MRKINSEDDKPLIYINWRKFLRYCKSFINMIILIVKKIIETALKIIKIILEVLILLMRGFLWIYRKFKQLIKTIFLALKKFSKKNIKGFWLLFTIAIFLIISILGLWKGYIYAQDIIYNLKETKDILEKQQEYNLKLLEENKQLKEEIEDKDKKLKVKAEEQTKYAHQQWILKNRQVAEQKLSEEVKTAIAKYANVYNVEDTRLIQCIVFYESGGRKDAIGDNGKAVGVAQYHLATFLGHRKQLGLPQIDLRRDIDASIQCMVFSISRGGIRNWTARSKCL